VLLRGIPLAWEGRLANFYVLDGTTWRAFSLPAIC